MPQANRYPETHAEPNSLHATTCLLMTRFINGHHCPKLSQQIVSQLQQLLNQPASTQQARSREMYRQLLAHWQAVTRQLLEKTSRPTVYH